MTRYTRRTSLALLLCVAGLNTGCAGTKFYAKTMEGGGVQAGLETVDRKGIPKVIDASCKVEGFDASATVRPMQALRDLGAGIKEVNTWVQTLAKAPTADGG